VESLLELRDGRTILAGKKSKKEACKTNRENNKQLRIMREGRGWKSRNLCRERKESGIGRLNYLTIKTFHVY